MTYLPTSNTPSIITHDGGYHADDLMGVAILRFVWPLATLARSRNPADWEKADFLVDVGGQFEPARGRFDHHQASFRGQAGSSRAAGPAYASAGLVWSAYGDAAIRKLHPEISDPMRTAVFTRVDQELIVFIDMVDNGEQVVAPGVFGLSALLAQLVPTWTETPTEKPVADAALLESFEAAVTVCQMLLKRVIAHAVAKEQAAATVRQAEQLEAGAVLVLKKSRLPWEDIVCEEFPAARFVVYPDSTDATFQVRTVPESPHSFQARMDLPEAWAGLRDKDLAQVTGVHSASFCHVKRFICGATDLDGAKAMALLALRN